MFSTAIQAIGLAAGLLAPAAVAQFPPTPEGVKVLESKLGNGVTISYKEPGICETTDGVKSYAGYVHLPPGTLDDLGQPQEYPINTFFWFFEARKNPENAPLSIWLNGGPGSSSLLGLFAENGPCYVNSDSNSTRLSEWSWNKEVNMLYLEQPVQVGFSYDTLRNYTYDLVSGRTRPLNSSQEIPEQNSTRLVGTFPSNNSTQTAQGSRNAAIQAWHFAQIWFQEFPGYHPKDSRISLATESYGGRYGPSFFSYFEEQNLKIENGTLNATEGENKVLNLDTLILINSCIDRQVMYPYYPHMAYNNTYGIQAVNETIYHSMIDAWERKGGCRDQIATCIDVSKASDPENLGINSTVNRICAAAENFCSSQVRGPFLQYSNNNYYDLATQNPDPFPRSFHYLYLNQPHVQAALGVPVNYTSSSGAVSDAFRGIGDYVRPGWVDDLAFLLENGIKVHLMYGDKDYACHWLGGEAVSLAINYTNTAKFHAAGYTDIVVNDTYVGGQVRQYGNLSFSRVYQAGHEIPSYQPETAYKMFYRALHNRDIATGEIDTAANKEYQTNGTQDTWAIKNEDPEDPVHFCYVWDVEATCSEEQIESIQNGSAVIVSGIVKDKNSTMLFPEIFNGTDEGGDGGGNGSEPSPTGSGPSPTELPGSAASSLLASGAPGFGIWTILAMLGYGILA
ncbi:carboxypeptidase S1 [Astrocystis sublimbata]|nr:carboxypeptidase S1 [Astrocystis sublimbata]